jgi:hypothetical protein
MKPNSIDDSFATGAVTVDGTGVAGGLVGFLEAGASEVRDSFAIGSLSGGEGSTLGGVVAAREGGFVIRTHWNTETTGVDVSAGGSGAIASTTDAMTFPFGPDVYSGWDFDMVWDSGDGSHPNNGYPFHRWQTARVNATYAAASGGSISGPASQVRIPGAATAAVTAVPDPGLRFLGWSDGRRDNPRVDVNLLADVSVTAAFGPPTSQWILH